MATESEKIVLGSGYLYVAEYTGTIPANTVIETNENLLGYIQGGASLEYVSTFYEAKDDLGIVSKTIITAEDVMLKSGIMTWNGNTLTKLSPTARVTESGGVRTVKIGGIANNNGKKYLIRFVHIDKQDGDIRITLVGQNQAGFTFQFAKDKETVINVEFKALSQDNEGTLVIYEEVTGILTDLTVTSVAGTSSGKTAITVSPFLTAGNSYVYKTAETVILPLYGDVCTTGWTAWTSGTEITATTGDEIAIVEIDSDSKAVGAGKTIVVSLA